MQIDLLEYGYQYEEILNAPCYTKMYDKTIQIVIFKSTVFVRNKVKFRQEEDILNEQKALKQGRYELRQTKLQSSV